MFGSTLPDPRIMAEYLSQQRNATTDRREAYVLYALGLLLVISSAILLSTGQL